MSAPAKAFGVSGETDETVSWDEIRSRETSYADSLMASLAGGGGLIDHRRCTDNSELHDRHLHNTIERIIIGDEQSTRPSDEEDQIPTKRDASTET